MIGSAIRHAIQILWRSVRSQRRRKKLSTTSISSSVSELIFVCRSTVEGHFDVRDARSDTGAADDLDDRYLGAADDRPVHDGVSHQHIEAVRELEARQR